MIHYRYLEINQRGKLVGLSKVKTPDSIPNTPTYGLRLSSKITNDIGIKAALPFVDFHLKHVSTSSGVISDGLVVCDVGNSLQYCIADRCSKQTSFVRVSNADIGKRVVVLGEKLPVTYMGSYFQVSGREGPLKKFAGFRRNDGSFLFRKHGTVIRITKAVDKWKTPDFVDSNVTAVSHPASRLRSNHKYVRAQGFKSQYIECDPEDPEVIVTTSYKSKATGLPVEVMDYHGTVTLVSFYYTNRNHITVSTGTIAHWLDLVKGCEASYKLSRTFKLIGGGEITV